MLRFLLVILLTIFYVGCGTDNVVVTDIAFDEVGVDSKHYCPEKPEGYNQSMSSYVDSTEVSYEILNTPIGMTMREFEAVFQEAVAPIREHMPIPIDLMRKLCLDRPDVEISVANIDESGSTLGQAWLPPISKYTKRPTTLNLDSHEFGEFPFNYNIVSVLRHEILHSLGVRHSDFPDALMFWKYRYSPDMTLDDIVAIRTIYNNLEDFEFEGRTYTFITDSEDWVAVNFKSREFFSGCHGAKPHWFDRSLIDAMQFLRDQYGAIKINSTYRDPQCNSQTSGASRTSKHMHNIAVDFRFLDPTAGARYRESIRNRDDIWQSLRSTYGVNGFGTYTGDFHHLDTRDSYSAWGFDSELSLTDLSQNGVD